MPLGPLKTPMTPGHMWRVARGVIVWSVLVLTLICINFLQMLSLLLEPISPRLVRTINTSLANFWWGSCVLVARKLNGTRIVTTGDELPVRENAILVVNHQEMPDITVIMDLAWRKRRLGHLKFFVKDQLKWVPGVGWGMYLLRFPFLKRNWTRDRDSIIRTFRRLVEGNAPMWLVIFPEGTRIRPHKHERAVAFARERGFAEPRHLLLPRPKGFVAAVQSLRGHAAAVYDLTIGYEGGVPTLGQYITGIVDRVHLHLRRFPLEELPESDEELATWLRQLWMEKDGLLDRFYENGSFPGPEVS